MQLIDGKKISLQIQEQIAAEDKQITGRGNNRWYKISLISCGK